MMVNQVRKVSIPVMIVLILFISSLPLSAENDKFIGCYEAVYDKDPLVKNGQRIVMRAFLEIKNSQRVVAPEEFEGKLSFWIKEHENKQFINYGSCIPKGQNLLCNGSLSGATALPCLKEKDGFSNTCRNFSYDNGKFIILLKSKKLLISLVGKLEFVEKDVSGEHLYLSQSNQQNNRFILYPTQCSQGY